MTNLAQRLRNPGGPVTQRDRLLAAELLEAAARVLRFGANGGGDWGKPAQEYAQTWMTDYQRDGGAR